LARKVANAMDAAVGVKSMQLSLITLAIMTKMEYLSMLTISSVAGANTAETAQGMLKMNYNASVCDGDDDDDDDVAFIFAIFSNEDS